MINIISSSKPKSLVKLVGRGLFAMIIADEAGFSNAFKAARPRDDGLNVLYWEFFRENQKRRATFSIINPVIEFGEEGLVI